MPTEEVRRLLLDGAARPSRRVDVGAIFRQGRRLRRVRVVSISALGAAALVVLAIAAGDLDSFVRGEQRNKEPNPAAAFPEGWTALSLPPEVREGMSVVWAGSRLLAWGGCDPSVDDACEPAAGGFEFDPAKRSWGPLEDAPVAGAHGDAIWTGKEAIFLLATEDRLRGQAYDPATETWRTTADAPLAPRSGAVAVWTGSELIVWGGGAPQDPTTVGGAAYDPIGDTWRRIADAPIGLNHVSGMWTGREMIVFGSLLDNRNVADTKTSVGAAYDPAADTWRELPLSELSAQATSALWANDRMVAWDYEVHSQEYDPARNVWSEPVRMPLDFSECYPDSVVARDLVFGFFCGRAALYEPGSGTWEEIHGGPLDENVESGAAGRPIKLWRFAQIASTGDTVFLLAEGITVGKTGEVCYGCPGAPASFWAYRPPG